jgi:hypothetical protein
MNPDKPTEHAIVTMTEHWSDSAADLARISHKADPAVLK